MARSRHWFDLVISDLAHFYQFPDCAEMALQVTEFFGFEPLDAEGRAFADQAQCPFVGNACIKPRHGACSVKPLKLANPVICCPNRMYAENFKALLELAQDVFGVSSVLIKPVEAQERRSGLGVPLTGNEVAIFGKYWGNELPLPRPKGVKGNETAKYYVDWIMAKLTADGDLDEIIAVEVQTIDTTGNYSDQAQKFFDGQEYVDPQGRVRGYSEAGMNWENVNKRILPQLIYKGHVLRRESKCKKGLFFVCPKQVYDRIRDRLGGNLHDYDPGQGTITFRSYELGPPADAGKHRSMNLHGQFTTTVDQVALAFTSPGNLPERNVYEAAIDAAMNF